MSGIAVVSCVWQRPERLRYMLAQLAAQTDKDFSLHLIVNNPELRGFVAEAIKPYDISITVHHNASNRGPYARIELMHELSDRYSHFMTLDDDVTFGADLIERWQSIKQDDVVMGWQGFCFVGDYWQRVRVEAGNDCHYLWGSNLLVPVAAVQDSRILDLPTRFWQCDDLWLCYFANHKRGLKLQPAGGNVSINIDGKDTYHTQHNTKIECLNWLRAEGWNV
jgi:hypothetical protein